MAPFPTRKLTSPTASLGHQSYPPPPSPLASPNLVPVRSSTPNSSSNGKKKHTPKPISTDPIALFGQIGLPGPGVLGGLGCSWQNRKLVQTCLMDNHINTHCFFNDDGLHNHTAHHLLAAYSLGAGPSLIKDIYELQKVINKPMLPLQSVEVNETNWTEFLGDANFYPNYLAFFYRLLVAPPSPPSPYAGKKDSVVPVLEKYLFGGEGEMLVRAVSGAIHPLIHIGFGVEFGLIGIVAEGLAQCCVHSPIVRDLFPSAWPPPPPKQTSFQSTLTSAFSSLKLGSSSSFLGYAPTASPLDNFASTAASLPREPRSRIPQEGLSGFTILDRILHDSTLGPGSANQQDDFPRLDKAIQNRGDEIRAWCEEWKFRGDTIWKSTPSWEEIVKKTEELFWMATVIYAAASRPGYVEPKMDFFTMHGLTSVLFLPPILEVISPHLRPYLLHSHFRVLVAYWISRGRPNLHVNDTLLASTPTPVPPNLPTFTPGAISRAILKRDKSKSEDSSDDSAPSTPSVGVDGKVKSVNGHNGTLSDHEEEKMVSLDVNPWPGLMVSATDHPDEHVPKVIRTLAYAATHFGHSPPGLYQCSLPGSEKMDGSIFARAAGLTFKALGYAREGEKPGSWDRSVLGFEAAWEGCATLPTFKANSLAKAKQRASPSVPTPSQEDETVVVVGVDGIERSPDEPVSKTNGFVEMEIDDSGSGKDEGDLDEYYAGGGGDGNVGEMDERWREERDEQDHELLG
ncbi:hypothetical protein T439DRAFT_318264 [Meredithblackwellia eburnea MCA 4105]